MTKKKKIIPRDYAEASAGVRLSAHEKICAERMKNLISSIERLEKKVDTLSDSVSKGKGIVAVLVFLGGLAATILGYLNFK
jgi:hypothetical protein